MGRNKMMHKNGKNNKGMTLVEVLVAMMILTVVSLVLLRAFVSATRYNKMAKEKQREINLAQSIMESCKAYNMEEIVKQFNGVDYFAIYSGTHGTVSEVGRYSLDTNYELLRNDGGGVPADADKYQFTIADVGYDGGLYDVELSFEPDSAVNSLIEIADVPEYNKFNDAFYTGETPAVADAKIVEDAKNFLTMTKQYDVSDPSNPDLDNVSDMKNYIMVVGHEINVTASNVSGVQKIVVTSTYDYEIMGISFSKTDGSYAYNENYGANMINDVTFTTTIFDTSVTGAAMASLNNIYLNYYPYYECGDSITINNGLGVTASGTRDVYLVKMNPGLSATQLNLFENAYRPSITANGCSLYTNAYTHLGTGNAIVGITPPVAYSTKLYKTKWKNLEYKVTIKVTNQRTGEEFELVGSIYDK